MFCLHVHQVRIGSGTEVWVVVNHVIGCSLNEMHSKTKCDFRISYIQGCIIDSNLY